MNRASWLSALAASLVVLQYKYSILEKIKQVLNTRTKKIIAITFALVIISGIGFGLFFLKAGSSNGRMFIWEVTLGKIAEKPLFGHGLGRFEAEYNNWQAEYFMKHPSEMEGPKGLVAGNTKYCFNEYLEIASETGIVGSLLFCSLLFFAFVGITEQKVKLLFSSLIGSMVILSFFSFPLYNLPLFMVFIIVLAFVSAVRQTIPILQVKPAVVMNYSLAAVLLGFGVAVGYKLPSDYASYQKWQEIRFFYGTDAYEPSVKEFESIYNAFKYNNGFLQQYGKACAMEKDYTKAKIHLKEAGKYGGDYILYSNLGDVYKELKQYPQAEMAYLHSADMVPHKLYPHHLMAKLYMQSGDTIKAKTKAKEVLAMNAKVNNMAEEEIKLEMKKILKK
jgi:O-antigen ligase